MPRLQRAYQVAAVHRVAGLQPRGHRLVARQQPAGVCDRQHPAVDHCAREVHRAVGRRPHLGARRCDIDSPVARRVPGERREERSRDRVRRRDRPRPGRSGGRRRGAPDPGRSGGRRRGLAGSRPHEQRENENRAETSHPPRMTREPTAQTNAVRSARIRPSDAPVRDRTGVIVLGALCVSTATTRARCDFIVAQRHPLSHIEAQVCLRLTVPDACRAPGSRPTGRDNN